ncbi:MAG: FAD/NAD(P)-binding protein [Spirochaetales bacterium]|nr:FAD/NAD(P)-binding protein [Spirochaetales bacterium]
MYTSKNPYRPVKTIVLDVITETPTIKTFVLQPETPISFETGQFIEFSVPGCGEAPFTPSSRPSVSDTLEVTIMRVGKVTTRIHELKKNDIVGLRGPFGSRYPVELFKDKEVLVIGGGCGFAPVRSLMYKLFEIRGDLKKLVFRGGCRNPKEFLYRDELESWTNKNDLNIRLTVDKSDGDTVWKHDVGLVTTILGDVGMDVKNGFAVVCGPPIMMKFTTGTLLDMGFREDNIFLSMEKNMSCGIGKCGHCRIGTYYACKDGPVFRYDAIKKFPNIWD